MNAERRHHAIGFSQKVASSLKATESLCLKIRETLIANGLSGRCFPVELLARECLANAVNHGNRRDADKSVVISFSVGRQWIRLEVGDDGPGFDWRSTRKKQSDIAVPSGRGLPLYTMYADRVQFNRRGNLIRLWISKKEPTGKEE